MHCPQACPEACRRACEGLLAWAGAHRRLIVTLLLVSLVMFLIGRFAPQTSNPLLCKIYG